MAPPSTMPLLFLTVIVAELGFCFPSQVYVVYMGSKRNSGDPDEALKENHQMLSSVHSGSMTKGRESHLYSYNNGFRGFAAKLTEEQAAKMTEIPGVVSVFPNMKRSLHTTHSWDFMGLTVEKGMELSGYSTYDQDNVIIGFIDTGIWPESPSFSDEDMSPVPSRWKGQCQSGEPSSNFSCNKKIIGARYYTTGYEAEEGSDILSEDSGSSVGYNSPRDSIGHGSHTASTAAGRIVKYDGLGGGGARGGAPMARIAVYKSCWESGCYDVDLLAAFDDAIKDGVDVISISLGPSSPQSDYSLDPLSIGSFHATSHGITVVTSAGNDGAQGSATNLAPWMLTVAASSTDRDFASSIVLGNGETFIGESLSSFRMISSVRTISASEASEGYFTPYQSSLCIGSSLSQRKAEGKILLCRHSGDSSESRLEKSVEVKRAGGVGMILIDGIQNDVAIPFVIPAASVGKSTGDKILSYINNTRASKSRISPTKVIEGSRPAPRMASFSSKGPNSLTPEILKPDIAAPGLNILAAWSPAVSKMDFNIVSGTSMSCPHVTGIVALIKSVYPMWSPAAIKSAIMTTATVLDMNGSAITAGPEGRPANPFDYGAGLIEPLRVLKPGIVYDSQPSDNKDFLCSIGYDDESLQLVTGDHSSSCSHASPSASNMNYPSITVPNLKGSYMVTRTVTNVGRDSIVYRATVSPPDGVNVTVVPMALAFRFNGEKLSFNVTFRATGHSKDYVYGSLTWTGDDTGTTATSPLVVRIASSIKGFY